MSGVHGSLSQGGRAGAESRPELEPRLASLAFSTRSSTKTLFVLRVKK